MSDEPNRWNGLLANLLAMKDLSWAPDLEPAAENYALRLSPAQIDAVRTALSGEVRDWLEDRTLATKLLDSMTQDELDEVYDAAHSALMNAAPIVRWAVPDIVYIETVDGTGISSSFNGIYYDKPVSFSDNIEKTEAICPAFYNRHLWRQFHVQKFVGYMNSHSFIRQEDIADSKDNNFLGGALCSPL